MRCSGTDRQKPPSLSLGHQLPFQVENFILHVKREHTSWGAGVPPRASDPEVLRHQNPRQKRHLRYNSRVNPAISPSVYQQTLAASALVRGSRWRMPFDLHYLNFLLRRNLPTTVEICELKLLDFFSRKSLARCQTGVPFLPKFHGSIRA
jgi:hypothetical protein